MSDMTTTENASTIINTVVRLLKVHFLLDFFLLIKRKSKKRKEERYPGPK